MMQRVMFVGFLLFVVVCRPSLAAFASCSELLEFEQLEARPLVVGDLDRVEALLPKRSPATHWREIFLEWNARNTPAGIVLAGRTPETRDSLSAVITWRPTGDGVDLIEFHVVSPRLRTMGVERWLLERVLATVGRNAVIRMVVPDLDRVRAGNLTSLGFTAAGTDPNAFGLPGLLEGVIYQFNAPESAEADPPAPEAESGRPAIQVREMAPDDAPAVAALAEERLGAAGRTEVELLLSATSPQGGPFVVVARDGGDITGFVIYSLDAAQNAARIEYSLFPAGDGETARQLIELVHVKALGRNLEWLLIDVPSYGGDTEPYLQFGFVPDEDSGGDLLRYTVGT